MTTKRSLVLMMMVGLCCYAACAQEQGAAVADTQDCLKFKWAFLLQDQDGNTRAADFNDTVTVKQGDALQIYLEPETNTYVYLYMFDAQRQLRCLFPPMPELHEQTVMPTGPRLLPSVEKFFIMDEQAGTEKFYLLASTRRLLPLEDLTLKQSVQPDDDEVKAQLLDEIQSIRRDQARLTAPVEKGVPIAGTVVAVTRGPEIEATLTEASGFYARTLRIEHE